MSRLATPDLSNAARASINTPPAHGMEKIESALNYSVAGYVAALANGNILSGWVKITNSPVPARLEIRNGDRVIGTGIPSIMRSDIGGINGFRLTASETFSEWDLISGAVTCMVMLPDDSEFRLPLTQKLMVNGAISFLTTVETQMLDETSLASLTKLLEDAVTAHRDALYATLTAFPEQSQDIEADSVGGICFPPGTISSDGSAIFGHGNHAFLLQGSNGLLSQYAADRNDDHVKALATRWADLIAGRASQCHASGKNFLQIVIPEKSSTLAHLFPRIIPRKTAIMECVEREVLGNAQIRNKVIFAGEHLDENCCQLLDTHLNALGAFRVTKAVLAKLDIAWPFPEPAFETKEIRKGDLAGRFISGHPLLYTVAMPSDEFVSSLPVPVLTEKTDSGRNIGSMRKWHTPQAPVDLHVLAFGNSNFERGGTATTMSWWFSRIFRHFTFYWIPEMSEDVISIENPDLIICQTIERFLPRIPNR